MKNNISISEYFDGINEIFNPTVAYQGNYAFSADVFSYMDPDIQKNLITLITNDEAVHIIANTTVNAMRRYILSPRCSL